MSVDILQHRYEINDARSTMRRRGISVRPREWICKLLTGIGRGKGLTGDFIKSWDVWKTAEFLEQNIDKKEPIADFGAYRSEILPVLSRMGFTSLHGIDLNPDLKESPYSSSVDYTVGDFYRTPYSSNSISAVTSISAIEHGLDLQRLLREVSRVLRPGGYFICSTDYWPHKIDTADVKVFNLSWTIFSSDELERLIRDASAYELSPVGPVTLSAATAPITFERRSYTFAWLALRKNNVSQPLTRNV